MAAPGGVMVHKDKDLRLRLTRLTEAHGILQRDFSKNIEDLETTQLQSKALVSTLEQEAEQHRARIAELEAQVRDADEERTKAEERHAALDVELDALRTAQIAWSADEEAAKTMALQFEVMRLTKEALELDCAGLRDALAGALVAAAAANRAADDSAGADAAADAAALRGQLSVAAAAHAAAQRELQKAVAESAGFEVDAAAQRSRAGRAELLLETEAARTSQAKESARQHAERAMSAERAFAKEGSKCRMLSLQTKALTDEANLRVEDVTNNANAALASERARADDLERRLRALQKQFDDAARAPRASHFGAFVKLKERNEELSEQLHGLEQKRPQRGGSAVVGPVAAAQPPASSRGDPKSGASGRVQSRRRQSNDDIATMLDDL
ncbi:hypothetical protein M885DRAFT_514931 [Pelagophyceae sp. CCMP2097]|nr:hypothetical protein M885DRAFT_514931 [Pelagophyceae sp. CCMP2097]